MEGDGSTRAVPENQPPPQNLSTAKSLKKFIRRIVPSYLQADETSSDSSSDDDQAVANGTTKLRLSKTAILPQELEISLNSHTSILNKFISDSSTKTLFVEKVTIQSDSGTTTSEDDNDDKIAKSPESLVEVKTEARYEISTTARLGSGKNGKNILQRQSIAFIKRSENGVLEAEKPLINQLDTLYAAVFLK